MDELRRSDNPFTPGDGLYPPELISREAILDEFEEGLEGNYSRLNMRISGPRCSGKTALLIGLSEIAKKHGWLTIRLSGNKTGVLERIADAIPISDEVQSSIAGSIGTSASIAGIGIAADTSATIVSIQSYRRAKQRMIKYIHNNPSSGIVIALDEVQSAKSEDIVDVCNLLQEMRMDRLNAAFIVAGKPGYIKELIGNNRIDYMRKAHPYSIGRLDEGEIWFSLRNQFKQFGINVSDKTLDILTERTYAFPILVQYIGAEAYTQAWLNSKQSDGTAEIKQTDCDTITRNAYARYKNETLKPIIDHATDNEIAVLLSLAKHNGTAKAADILTDTGFERNTYSFIRSSLLAEGIIDSVSRGKISISVPFLSAWLKASNEELTARIEESRQRTDWINGTESANDTFLSTGD